jgi:hypothetical protein
MHMRANGWRRLVGMYQLEFTHAYDYSGEDDSVVIPVVLRVGANQVPVAASLDTGASFCLFGAGVAEALGLALTNGVRQRFRTANSAFEAYGHAVELHALGVATHFQRCASSRRRFLVLENRRRRIPVCAPTPKPTRHVPSQRALPIAHQKPLHRALIALE